MFARIDIEEKLTTLRKQRNKEQDILEEIQSILSENNQHREQIAQALTKKPTAKENQFNVDLLYASRVFHLSDIKKICIDYRLRFLDAHYFKGEIPEEAISEIRYLETKHKTILGNFKILAPAKLL